jgi:hypothetical protein
MVDLLEFRVRKLTGMSAHYRELAADLFPEKVSGEIAAVADAFDDEVARINRDCAGRRACPCEFIGSCVALRGANPVFEVPGAKKAA